ncbi:Alpha/beta hydrolase fold-1 [Fusarium avenaceum]|nr:Alpha/beta hydrolase fold-1 [Fusarium avenaceum]
MTSNDQKPIVLFVPGAWHAPVHYRLLIKAIQAEGFTVLAPTLASSGYDDSIDGMALNDDVKRINDMAVPYLDKGRKVIAVGHSYGAVPLQIAVNGQTVAEREEKGLQGGFISTISIAPAPVLQKDTSMYESGGGKYSSDWFHDVSGTRLPLKTEKLKEAFFSDIEQSLADEIIPTLCQQSRGPFEVNVVCTPADLNIPKTVVLCKNDTIFTKDIVAYVADKWGATVVEIESGHSPHLIEEHRKWIAEFISREAEKLS